MDYEHIEILPLYTKPIDLRQVGANALVCGWGTVLQDDVLDNATGEVQYSQNLHCMGLNLSSPLHCKQAFSSKDFRRKLICGLALSRRQKITLVIASENWVYV